MAANAIAGQTELRAALRNGTAEAHEELDRLVGSFATVSEYGTFVMRSLRFRQVAEAAVAGAKIWRVEPLVSALRQDLSDLRLPATPLNALELTLASESERMGALYVLEGSALGGRLLLRRAQALGFSERFGARHLAYQTGDAGRWKAFLAILGGDTFDHDAAVGAARRTFDAAIAIYSEDMHEQA